MRMRQVRGVARANLAIRQIKIRKYFCSCWLRQIFRLYGSRIGAMYKVGYNAIWGAYPGNICESKEWEHCPHLNFECLSQDMHYEFSRPWHIMVKLWAIKVCSYAPRTTLLCPLVVIILLSLCSLLTHIDLWPYHMIYHMSEVEQVFLDFKDTFHFRTIIMLKCLN